MMASLPAAAAPTLVPSLETTLAWAAAAAALLLAGLFATFREALEQCSPIHVLEELDGAGDELIARRTKLEAILPGTPRMTTSAGMLEVLFGLGFVLLFLRAADLAGLDGDASMLARILVGTALTVPPLLVVTRLLPPALNRARGESILASVLPTFFVLDRLLTPLIWPLDLIRRITLRLFGLREEGTATRILVEDLRDVIEDTGLDAALPESGLELIENVMDFHDVDVAAVMTPRTEIEALDVEATPAQLIERIATSGHSRIPVFEESVDAIIGWISARDVIGHMDAGTLEGAKLADIIRPAKFVPETKKIPDLLEEFREEHFKLAVVLDEYGGTAGLVTLGDVLEELIGEMHDEYDQDEDEAIRRLGPVLFEVPGAEHVSDVNEALGLDLPEEDDFETIAGFVLARLGRFPEQGEAFTEDGVEYRIAEATDRRVLWVRVLLAKAPDAA